MRHALSVVAVAVLFALPAAADDFCATSRQLTHELREVTPYARAVARQVNRDKATADEYRDGIFVVHRDDVMTPYDDPFDLAGRSLTFTRASDGSYSVSNGPLQYEEDRGTLVRSFTREELIATTAPTVTRNLPFAFPMGSRTHQQIFISGLQAIFFSDPERFLARQFNPASVYGMNRPLVAPLLFGSSSSGYARGSAIYVREDAQSATVTWVTSHFTKQVDIQATLFANGNVRYSYKTTVNSPAGVVALMTGEEQFRNNRSSLVLQTDPSNDADAAAGAFAGMLDITSAEVTRVGGTELLELQIRTREAIVRPNLANRTLRFLVNVGATLPALTVNISRTQMTLQAGAWPSFASDPALSLEGNTITIRFTRDVLPAGSSAALLLRAQSVGGGTITADTANLTLPLGNAAPFELDFSAPPASAQSRPFVEAFTVAPLLPDAVAETVASRHGLATERLNNIAIYQTFLTDIIFFASGYSTGGNPGEDNFVTQRPYAGSQLPREPALLHVNTVGYGANNTPEGAYHLIGHEFGHHWLYEINIVDQTGISEILYPVSSHPAQYVDTRAAFPVRASTDSSLMGGGYFQQRDDGKWFTPTGGFTYFGLSWHELYLMGLARPSEVQPWFYLAGTSPELGPAYEPPSGWVGDGQRVNVSIGQALQAMGVRSPAWDGKQKEMRGIFILLDRPEAPATEAEIALARSYMNALIDGFDKATSGRARVFTRLANFTHEEPRGAAARTISFRDASSAYPASWRWDFGDGTTSTEQNPMHTFAQSGVYDVSLTIRTISGIEETVTNRVAVTVPNSRVRRR